MHFFFFLAILPFYVFFCPRVINSLNHYLFIYFLTQLILGANINAISEKKSIHDVTTFETALHIATKSGNIYGVTILLNAGADVINFIYFNNIIQLINGILY